MIRCLASTSTHGQIVELQQPTCVMQGRRLPEIAAGAFTEYVKSTLEFVKAKLVVYLPRDISSERRAGLVAEFERAGAMLLFTFTLKTSSLAVPPGLLFKCGHHNDVLARDALLKCLASSSSSAASSPECTCGLMYVCACHMHRCTSDDALTHA